MNAWTNNLPTESEVEFAMFAPRCGSSSYTFFIPREHPLMLTFFRSCMYAEWYSDFYFDFLILSENESKDEVKQSNYRNERINSEKSHIQLFTDKLNRQTKQQSHTHTHTNMQLMAKGSLRKYTTLFLQNCYGCTEFSQLMRRGLRRWSLLSHVTFRLDCSSYTKLYKSIYKNKEKTTYRDQQKRPHEIGQTRDNETMETMPDMQ